MEDDDLDFWDWDGEVRRKKEREEILKELDREDRAHRYKHSYVSFKGSGMLNDRYKSKVVLGAVGAGITAQSAGSGKWAGNKQS